MQNCCRKSGINFLRTEIIRLAHLFAVRYVPRP
jgi:hypothetical protein